MNEVSTLELICYCVVMIVGILASVFLAIHDTVMYASPAVFSILFVVVMNFAHGLRN